MAASTEPRTKSDATQLRRKLCPVWLESLELRIRTTSGTDSNGNYTFIYDEVTMFTPAGWPDFDVSKSRSGCKR